jgi:hypothetical protein
MGSRPLHVPARSRNVYRFRERESSAKNWLKLVAGQEEQPACALWLADVPAPRGIAPATMWLLLPWLANARP